MSTAKHTKAWRDRKKQQGLCPSCGKNQSIDGKRCSICYSKTIELNKGRFEQRYNSGLCDECGKNPYRPGKKLYILFRKT